MDTTSIYGHCTHLWILHPFMDIAPIYGFYTHIRILHFNSHFQVDPYMQAVSTIAIFYFSNPSSLYTLLPLSHVRAACVATQ